MEDQLHALFDEANQRIEAWVRGLGALGETRRTRVSPRGDPGARRRAAAKAAVSSERSERNSRLAASGNDAVAEFPRTLPGQGDDAAFEALTALAHPDFSLVFPSGAHFERGAFWDVFRSSWGSNPDFRIRTPRDGARLLFEDARLVVGELLELQLGARASPRQALRCTLVCSKAADARHGLLLWRLHESRVPDEELDGLDWSLFD